MSERDLLDSRVRSYLAISMILVTVSGALFFGFFGSGGMLMRFGNFFIFMVCAMVVLLLVENILGLERPLRNEEYPS